VPRSGRATVALTITSAGIVTLALSNSARSADLPLIPAVAPSAADAPTMPLKAPPATLPAWTGFYFGGHVGYVAVESGWATATTGAGGLSQSGTADIFDRDGPWGPMTGGVQGGYTYMFPSHYFAGIEADISFANHLSAAHLFSSPATGLSSITDKVELLSTLRARAGYAFGSLLFYGTGGLALDRDLLQNTQLAGMSPGIGVLPGNVDQAYFSRYGWTVGLGAEWGLSRNWSAKLEYDFMDFRSQGVLFGQEAQQYTSNLAIQSVLAGLNYHFGDGSLPQAQPMAAAPSDVNDVLSVHGQTTWIDQGYPAFHAPYSGAQSLYPGGEWRDTISVDGFLGLKLWEGGALYYNPEIFQGYGLTGTLGIAGFPNGEAQKAGFLFPRYNTAHLLVQQTIGLGGEQESIEEGPYDMEPWPDDGRSTVKQDVSRIVITAGKMAVTDIFDSNTYAHDPRTSFMNWSIMTAGAFDYAADMYGYTWGAAVDLHQRDWSLRTGYFLEPTVPNGNDYDTEFFHRGQYIVELEERYAPFSLPGHLQLTGWLSSGFAGSFAATLANSALDLDITQTRETRLEYGFIVNLEQAVTKDFGLFSRLSWQDGQTEIMAWTDIDRSASFGGVLQGTSWGRPADRIGIAGVVNGISNEYRAFLAAGGLGIVIGDGQLNYTGEKILEAYYWYAINKWSSLTFDYQFVADPAYNADRGPVSIFTARFHAEF
jgi:high affinity Mn2+ porin